MFESAMFKETVEECNEQIKMIEIKLSQGAKTWTWRIVAKGEDHKGNRRGKEASLSTAISLP